MIFRQSGFQTLSRGLVCLHDTCMLCFLKSCWIHNSSLQFPETGSVSLFLCCTAWPHPLELPTFSSVFEGFFVFITFQVDKINASQPSNIMEFWLLVCPFLLFSLLIGFSNVRPYLRPHILRSGSCLNFCYSHLGRINRFGGFSINSVNFVNPSQESDKLRFASTFQQSSRRFSCNTSRFV